MKMVLGIPISYHDFESDDPQVSCTTYACMLAVVFDSLSLDPWL
jgi:hypothetical protein